MLGNIPTAQHDYEDVNWKTVYGGRIPRDHLDYIFLIESKVCEHPIQARFIAELDGRIRCNVCGRKL